MASQVLTQYFARLAMVAGKVLLWTAVLYPLLFVVVPVLTASIMRISYLIRGVPPGGNPLEGKKDIRAFIREEDAAEMKRRGINPDIPLLKKVAAESITYSSGLTAVLLQIAQDGVGKGVGRHSNFSTRLLERSQNTAIFIYIMVYGNNTERQLFRNFVTRAHVHVNDKRKNPNEPTYDALNPELQLWVAATMYVSMLESYEKVFGKLPEAEQEAVYQEFSVFGTALQMPLRLWPENRAAFKSYWDDMIKNMKVPAEAYKTTRDLFQPKYDKLPLRLAILLFMTRPFNIATAAEELPDHIAVQFGLKSTWRTKLLYHLFGAFQRLVFPWYPKWVRQWQKDYYLWMMRERMTRKGMTRNGKHISMELLAQA